MYPPRPSMRSRVALAMIAAAALLSVSTTSAFAGEDESGVPGEVMIKTPYKFVKFQVDGRSSWENHTYIGGQKTLHIFGLSRDTAHTIVVQPRMEPGYQPIQIDIDPEKFKRKKVRRDGERIIVFQQVFSIRFKKESAEADKVKPGDDKPGKKKAPRKRTKSKKK